MNHNLMFSSKSTIWETPQEFFDRLNEEFHFTLDAAALKENAKCKNYFSPEENGLEKEWNGIVWCNPPYGRKETGLWVRNGL